MLPTHLDAFERCEQGLVDFTMPHDLADDGPDKGHQRRRRSGPELGDGSKVQVLLDLNATNLPLQGLVPGLLAFVGHPIECSCTGGERGRRDGGGTARQDDGLIGVMALSTDRRADKPVSNLSQNESM